MGYRPAIGATVRARRLRSSPTDAELRMWRLLRENFPDARFRRQVPFLGFTVDFASHRRRIIIEADGSQHGGPDDRRRDRLLATQGYLVLRFWNNDVLGNADGVMSRIAAACTGATPTPTLPHQGGGGNSETSQ